jgi:undecaprenol kinase
MLLAVTRVVKRLAATAGNNSGVPVPIKSNAKNSRKSTLTELRAPYAPPEIPREWRSGTAKNSSVTEALYHAFMGIKCAWTNERVLKLHVAGSALFCTLGFYLEFDFIRWSILILCIGMLIVSELINTAIERVADMGSQYQFNQLAREAKDVAAGAVLCCVIAAITTATILACTSPKAHHLALNISNRDTEITAH